MDVDFGYNQNDNGDGAGSDNGNDGRADITNLNTGGIENNLNGEPIDDVNGKKNDTTGVQGIDDGDSKGKSGKGDKSSKDTESQEDSTKVEPLQAGTTIEVGDNKYTVDESGNVIDINGNIFKEANAVKEWLESFEKVDDTVADGISIESIQEAIGIDVTDENNKPLNFENTPEGVNAYVKAVIESAREDNFKTAINSLYQKYPIIEDVLNYYIANGESLDGYGQMPDRSNVVIDESNEQQQEAIIRIAWEEQGRKGDVESYIQYLKSSGILLATAKEELEGIQESDKQYREQLREEAERRENEKAENLRKYWDGVHDIVKSRNIAGYQIPENIIITRNGQKLSVTPEDFFNYIYRVDSEGKSAYERDLMQESIESRRDDEILRAYLKFVGGNYSNLVNMAVNKDKVNNLKLRAKERKNNSVRINRPVTTTTKSVDIDLGYN